MRTRLHLRARQRLFRQVRQRRIRRVPQHRQRVRIARELRGIDQPALRFIERVRRQRVAFVKIPAHRRAKSLHQPRDLRARRGVARLRVRTRQPRQDTAQNCAPECSRENLSPGSKCGFHVYHPPRSAPGAATPAFTRNGFSSASSSIARKNVWFASNCALHGPSSSATSPYPNGAHFTRGLPSRSPRSSARFPAAAAAPSQRAPADAPARRRDRRTRGRHSRRLQYVPPRQLAHAADFTTTATARRGAPSHSASSRESSARRRC